MSTDVITSIIEELKEGVAVVNSNQGSLADADPIALIALGATIVFVATLVTLYIVFGKESRR